MPSQRGTLLLNFSPVATMPLHHGVDGHPHVLDHAPLAGYEVHYVSRFTSEPVPHFVCPARKVAGKGASLFHSRAGFTFPAPSWVLMFE